LELALACPVRQASEVVGVAVADEDRRHRRQGSVASAGIEGEPELRQQDEGAVAGA
jgi:hypothetical protein